MPVRFYRSILFPLLLLLAGLPLSAQAPAAPAPTWFKVASPSDWLIGVPLGTQIAWGDGANFSNVKTTTAVLFPTTGFQASAGQFNAVAGLNGVGGLYVQETATAFLVTDDVFPSMAPTTVTVPTLAPPVVVPATPPASIASALQTVLQYLQSAPPGVENLVQITCGLAPATLPPTLALPLYGTPPLYCVFAPIQQSTAPVVPPTPPSSMAK